MKTTLYTNVFQKSSPINELMSLIDNHSLINQLINWSIIDDEWFEVYSLGLMAGGSAWAPAPPPTEPWAMSLEPLTIDNKSINQFINWSTDS